MSRWFDPWRKIPGAKGKEALTDIWTPHWARIWLRLVPDYTDLELEECGETDIGERSGAIEYEMSNDGLDSWFHGTHIERCTRIGKYKWSCGWAMWALEHGIAPRQPFLVQLEEPYYTTSVTMDGTEYDCDCDWKLVRVLHWQPSVALRYWSRWLAGTQKIYAAEMEEAERRASLVKRDVGALNIDKCWFCSGGYYDDMAMPDRVRLTMYSKHANKFVSGHIAQVEAKDYTEGYEKLLAKAREVFPDLTMKHLEQMPKSGSW